jgi:uncharacterized membrane protein YgcG
LRARVADYETRLQAHLDHHLPPVEHDDAMQIDLFADDAEASATLRPMSDTQIVGVNKRECIAALQHALVDMLGDEDLALQQQEADDEVEEEARARREEWESVCGECAPAADCGEGEGRDLGGSRLGGGGGVGGGGGGGARGGAAGGGGGGGGGARRRARQRTRRRRGRRGQRIR